MIFLDETFLGLSGQLLTMAKNDPKPPLRDQKKPQAEML
jgi:hypothetical protein